MCGATDAIKAAWRPQELQWNSLACFVFAPTFFHCWWFVYREENMEQAAEMLDNPPFQTNVYFVIWQNNFH